MQSSSFLIGQSIAPSYCLLSYSLRIEGELHRLYLVAI